MHTLLTYLLTYLLHGAIEDGMFRPYWPLSGRVRLKEHRENINTGYQAQQLFGTTKSIHYLLTYLLHGAESFLRS